MTAPEMVAKARNLPQISEAALRVVDLMDESGDNREAIELIKSDALLTAKLLRVCNSSALGLAEQVSSVDHAIFLLGHNQVMNLVLSLAVGNTMNRAAANGFVEPHSLWRHAFLAGTAAECMINRGVYSDVESSIAFTAGLLHDIGKLVMGQALSAQALTEIQKLEAGGALSSFEAEREVAGADHAEVGACLMHVWRLPDSIIEAVANHHRPVLEPKPQLSAVAHLANRIAHLADAQSGSAGYSFSETERVVQAFDLDAKQRDELIAAVKKSADKSEDLLKVA